MGKKLKDMSASQLKQGTQNECATCSMLAFAVGGLQPDATFVRVYFDDNLSGLLGILMWSEVSEQSSLFELHTIPDALLFL
jgi:hypothetical protein